ncbi:MAG: hypothetical protein ACREE2_16665 [Stellaceae bacterium]
MALIRNRIGRGDGGYTRLFGDSQLGSLISRVQSAVISSGTELEKLIIERAPIIRELDEFLQQDIYPEGVYVATKAAIKKCKTIDSVSAEPDFVVFERRIGRQHCYIIELKDGDAFDTKKAAGERESLHRFVHVIAPLVRFTITVHFCSFHQNDRQAIVNGFKRKITWQEAMTGREFCTLLNIDYDKIVNLRKENQSVNFRYFLNSLLDIKSAREEIERQLVDRTISTL